VPIIISGELRNEPNSYYRYLIIAYINNRGWRTIEGQWMEPKGYAAQHQSALRSLENHDLPSRSST